jgi:hypothetical protein
MQEILRTVIAKIASGDPSQRLIHEITNVKGEVLRRGTANTVPANVVDCATCADLD